MKLAATVLVWLAAAVSHAQLQWSNPVMIVAPPAVRNIVLPEAAANPDGTVAAAWFTTDGRTSGALNGQYPRYWSSDLYAAFSSDRGLTWSTPKLLSDPTLHNHQLDIEPGNAPGVFYFSWASGDALSGYRHHIAKTTDNGETFTSTTRVQPFSDIGQGILFPDVAFVGDQLIANWDAIDQDEPDRPVRWYTSTINSNLNLWTEPVDSAPPYSTYGPGSIKSLTVSGSHIMATGHSSTDTLYSLPLPFVMHSHDGGTSWSEPQFITGKTSSYNPVTITDRKGLWITSHIGNNYHSAPTGPPSIGLLRVQKSTDSGVSWTPPELTSATASMALHKPLDGDTDTDGKWLLAQDNKYTMSDDNAETWTPWVSLPTGTVRVAQQILYVGDKKWGLLELAYSSGQFNLYLRTAQWGESSVSDWTLY